jgi:SAM-dependent methyltransferase
VEVWRSFCRAERACWLLSLIRLHARTAHYSPLAFHRPRVECAPPMAPAVDRCPLCHDSAVSATWQLSDRFYPTEGTFEVRRCGSCRSTYLSDPPDDMSAYYGDFYYSYNADAPVRVKGFKPWLKRLLFESPGVSTVMSRLPGRTDIDHDLATTLSAPEPRVLDIGCGRGRTLDVYRAHGWKTYGIEVGEHGAKAAIANGHQVLVRDFDELDMMWEPFDLVRATHVIEHVPDPLGALDKAASLVAPGGSLLIEVPNLAGWLARVSRSAYWQLDPPRHLAIPDRELIVAALQDADFSSVEVSTYSSGRGWATTFFMWRQRRAEHAGGDVWRLGDARLPRGYRSLELAGEPLATLSDAFCAGDSLRIIAGRARRDNGGALPADGDGK